MIYAADVPREYKTMADTSDQTFYDAFAFDLKRMTRMINLQKRMMGINDTDTTKGLEDDYKPEQFESL